MSRHPLLVAQRSISPYYESESFVKDVSGLVSLYPPTRSAKFSDGHIEHNIEIIIFCTGYQYSFPFLANFQPRIEEEPLYQYIFWVDDSTLAFVEMNEKVVPFPFAECQAAVIARVWSGRLILPSTLDMQKWGSDVTKERGTGRGFYALSPPLDLQYMNNMYNWCSQTSEDDFRGAKMPKHWDKKACWERLMAAEMKKAFNRRGEKRQEVFTYDQ